MPSAFAGLQAENSWTFAMSMKSLIHLFTQSLKHSLILRTLAQHYQLNFQKQAVMNRFLEKSEQQLFCGCDGAIDGSSHPIDKLP